MIIGIDLGTTNSLAAVFKDGRPQLIPNSSNNYITPSVVSIDQNNTILVGESAKQRLITHPNDTVAVFKRHMGTDKIIKLGQQKFRAEELSAILLARLKQDAECFLNEQITDAVISVPAYFNEIQRKATKTAAELAGLNVLRLINEPTAAALAYGINQNESEQTFLVFDLGGGTFDISILEMFDGVMEIRASTGDSYFGGEDFTESLIRLFLQKSGFEEKFNLESIKKNELAKFKNAIENAKCILSNKADVTIKATISKKEYSHIISRIEFEKHSEPLIKKLREPIERAMRDSKISAQEINQIFLVGGATRSPIIRKIVTKMFGIFPATNLNPDEVVALGTAVQAGLISNDETLEEIVVTDVCPYTLGTSVVEHDAMEKPINIGYLPIIERNSLIPISRSKTVATIQDNQQKVNVEVYQGESYDLKDNINLGVLTITLPPKPAGQPIEIRFSYDISGLLEVEATVLADGSTKKLLIENSTKTLSEKEKKECIDRLKKFKVHPRDQVENVSLTKKLLSIYERSIGETRTRIRAILVEFNTILDSQDDKTIKIARHKLTGIINDIERSMQYSWSE